MDNYSKFLTLKCLPFPQIRASVRTFNPKQLKYEDKSDTKFKHAVFVRNMNRVKAATAHIDLDAIGKEIA